MEDDATQLPQLLRRPVKTSVALARELTRTIVGDGPGFGRRLPTEKQLMAQYGVSRATLREALRLLEVQELISIVPGAQGGPVVTRPSTSSLAEYTANVYACYGVVLEDVITMRLLLEPMAARLAAASRTEEEATALLDSAVAIRGAEDDVFLSENQRFHELVATGSRNAALLINIAGLCDVAAGNTAGIRYGHYNRHVVADCHEEIARSIAAGDEAGAEQAMRDHMAQYQRFVTAHRPELLQRRISPLA